MYKVHNVPSNAFTYEYMIIRDCGDNGYWYYGVWNDVTKASLALREINNGIIVKSVFVECTF